jgi:hypothetical protein
MNYKPDLLFFQMENHAVNFYYSLYDSLYVSYDMINK